jgi:hypothetical protein
VELAPASGQKDFGYRAFPAPYKAVFWELILADPYATGLEGFSDRFAPLQAKVWGYSLTDGGSLSLALCHGAIVRGVAPRRPGWWHSWADIDHHLGARADTNGYQSIPPDYDERTAWIPVAEIARLNKLSGGRYNFESHAQAEGAKSRYRRAFDQYPPQELVDWGNAVTDLRRCQRLWDLLRANDMSALAKCFVWKGKAKGYRVWYDPSNDPRELPVGMGAGPEWPFATSRWYAERLRHVAPADPRSAAQLYVEATVNAHLRGRVRTWLLWDAARQASVPVAVPDDLYAGVWLEFAEAYRQDKSYEPCPICETRFDVSPEGSRKSRVYCSDACRLRAYRGRLKARELAREGKDSTDIALELDVTEATVERWLNQPQED